MKDFLPCLSGFFSLSCVAMIVFFCFNFVYEVMNMYVLLGAIKVLAVMYITLQPRDILILKEVSYLSGELS